MMHGLANFKFNFKTCLPANLLQSGSITFAIFRHAAKSTIQSTYFVAEADDGLCLQLQTFGLR